MMFKLFNTFGKRYETFKPVNPEMVSIFTCGPSVYQRPHIGNMRTFLFEDILVRYLQYLGYNVKRGMNLTDVEDKAISEAQKEHLSLKKLTDRNIKQFIGEMKLLKMKVPDLLPRASEHVEQAVCIIQDMLKRGMAYRYSGNIYFDPLKFADFGKLFGLDMSRWPKTRKRFHKDTYPGIQWNLGDFILWHGRREGDQVYWDTAIGTGRPSWNIQDPSMIVDYFDETLSVYCGGIDNLFRHHDYTLAILESIRPFPMARYWLHGEHLLVNGHKMSKSKGNIVYVDTLISQGYSAEEIRFFLIYGHYRSRMNYSDADMKKAAGMLREFKKVVARIRRRAGRIASTSGKTAEMMKKVFIEGMHRDMDLKGAFDGIYRIVSEIKIEELGPSEAAGTIKTLREIDSVLQVIF
ncbi:MAG TPA: class I tRNA ligase family protein [Dissulfurispiraceae bacterium]|nr:class I tRNA ligase family protein [Dissulfurispiraceae bacterium]